MAYTPDEWENNDPTKPLNGPRLTKMAGQYPQVMADLPAKITNASDPIGAAISTAVSTAITAVSPVVVSIQSFVNSGESLVLDGSGIGNNTTIFQRAVDSCNAAYLADGRPRKIYFPRGSRVRLGFGSSLTSGGTTYGMCVRWKSGVGIATDTDYDVIFYAPSNATPFFAARDYGNIEDVYCDSHVVDGSAQTNTAYVTRLKGWFVQGLKHFQFDKLKVINTFATGFGCDYLVDGKVTGIADGCGRGILERQADTGANYRTVTTTSGSSTVTSSTITADDAKRPITGAGIPAGCYVGNVVAGVSFQLTSSYDALVPVNATASATVSARLGFEPLTTSGGSGFGIGTGRYEVEDFELDVTARNNGFHGVFTEYQVGEPFSFTKGSRIRALVQGNYVGFRDCGSDGLQADIVALSNTFGVLHDATILATNGGGINGRVRVHADKNIVGIKLGKGAGPFKFTGRVMASTSYGIRADSTATLNRIDISDMDVNGNGSKGVSIAAQSTDLTLHRVRGYGNTGADIELLGTGNVSPGLEVTDCDVRAGGLTLEQLPGLASVIARNRGAADSGGPTAYDSFTRAATVSLGQTEVGAKVWNNPSSAWEIDASGMLSLVTGLSTGTYFATFDGTVDGRVFGLVGALNGTSTSRRLRLVMRYTDANNFITFGSGDSANQYVVTENAAGVATTLATYTFGWATGITLGLEVIGTTVKAYRNGALLGTVTTAVTTGTGVGARSTQADAVTAFDNISFYAL